MMKKELSRHQFLQAPAVPQSLQRIAVHQDGPTKETQSLLQDQTLSRHAQSGVLALLLRSLPAETVAHPLVLHTNRQREGSGLLVGSHFAAARQDSRNRSTIRDASAQVAGRGDLHWLGPPPARQSLDVWRGRAV